MRPPGLGPPSHSPSHWQSPEGPTTLIKHRRVKPAAACLPARPPAFFSRSPLTAAQQAGSQHLSQEGGGDLSPTTETNKKVKPLKVRTFLIQRDQSVRDAGGGGAIISL